MAKPKKTKSGKWHCLVYDHTDENGKRVYKSITADTKAQCEYLASKYKVDRSTKIAQIDTLRSVINKYIESEKNVLAQTTFDSYIKIRDNAFKGIMDMPVDEIDELVLQDAVNKECTRLTYCGKPISPKTVCNEYGLVSAAMRRICHKSFDIRLPKKIKRIKDFPEPAEIVKAVRKTDIELPCLLAMWLSFSMSEIKGIDCSAVRDGMVRIEKVRVMTTQGEIVKPTGKVSSRIRNHALPTHILGLIYSTDEYIKYAETGENGPLITMTRNEIYKHWKKICDSHGWQMSFHDLRAVSASVMARLRISDKVAQERGGWSSDRIMKNTYQQVFEDDRLEADKKINNYFESIICK